MHDGKNKNKERRHRSPLTIAVTGTVSAGKTTLINAMMGRELLFSSNEPATSCQTILRHRPYGRQLTGACYNAQGTLIGFRRNVQYGKYLDWNSNPNVTRVHISGDFERIAGSREKINIHDLPGANNSLDTKHWGIAVEALSSARWNLLCFVLDATALGITDENELLVKVAEISESRPDAKILFAINKVDELDADRDQSIGSIIDKTQSRLIRTGFKSPWVVPVIARMALTSRLMGRGQPVSARQRLAYQMALPLLPGTARDILSSAHIPQSALDYMRISENATKNKILNYSGFRKDHTNHTLLASTAASGILTIEAVIRHCISSS